MAEINFSDVQERITKRLNLILDECVSPFGLHRIRDFSYKIDEQEGLLKEYLSGRMTPPLETLVKVCAFSGREIDYFFSTEIDKAPINAIFSSPLIRIGPKVPVALSDVVIRGGVPAGAEWTYLVAKGDMGFGIMKGDYIFSYKISDSYVEVSEGSIYIMGSAEDMLFDVKQCSEIRRGKVVFSSFYQPTFFSSILNVPLLGRTNRVSIASLEKAKISHCSEIVSTSRQDYKRNLDTIPLRSLVQISKVS